MAMRFLLMRKTIPGEAQLNRGDWQPTTGDATTGLF